MFKVMFNKIKDWFKERSIPDLFKVENRVPISLYTHLKPKVRKFKNYFSNYDNFLSAILNANLSEKWHNLIFETGSFWCRIKTDKDNIFYIKISINRVKANEYRYNILNINNEKRHEFINRTYNHKEPFYDLLKDIIFKEFDSNKFKEI